MASKEKTMQPGLSKWEFSVCQAADSIPVLPLTLSLYDMLIKRAKEAEGEDKGRNIQAVTFFIYSQHGRRQLYLGLRESDF